MKLSDNYELDSRHDYTIKPGMKTKTLTTAGVIASLLAFAVTGGFLGHAFGVWRLIGGGM